jgi:3'(2'), 5'-bisphosphate nucleotidase
MGALKIPEADDLFDRFHAEVEAAAPEAVSDKIMSLLGNVEKLPLPRSDIREKNIAVVASRSHFSPETEQFIESVRSKLPEGGEIELVQAGSSLKLCLVAEGTADVYPRFGPTMEWDTAAGQAIAEAAGAEVVIADAAAQAKDFAQAAGSAPSTSLDAPLRYNKENLLNPWFIVKGKRYEQISSQSSS